MNYMNASYIYMVKSECFGNSRRHRDISKLQTIPTNQGGLAKIEKYPLQFYLNNFIF